MTQHEMYDFIGELALTLYSKKIKISLSSLNSILKDQDKEKEYSHNRGLAKAVSAAYKHWKEKDELIHTAIAYTYTNKDGNLPWA